MRGLDDAMVVGNIKYDGRERFGLHRENVMIHVCTRLCTVRKIATDAQESELNDGNDGGGCFSPCVSVVTLDVSY